MTSEASSATAIPKATIMFTLLVMPSIPAFGEDGRLLHLFAGHFVDDAVWELTD